MSARHVTLKTQRLELPPIKQCACNCNVPIAPWKQHLNERSKAESRQHKEDTLLAELLRSDLFV